MKKLLLALLLAGCSSGLTEAKVDGLQVYVKHKNYMDKVYESSEKWAWKNSETWLNIIGKVSQALRGLRAELAMSGHNISDEIQRLEMVMPLVDGTHLRVFDNVYYEIRIVEKAKKKVEKYGLGNDQDWKDSYEKFYKVLDKFHKVIMTNDVSTIDSIYKELIASEAGMRKVYATLENKE